MKKAKFILAAVAVMAIAGGTVAFKAANRGSVNYFTTNAYNAIAPATNVVLKAKTISGADADKVYWTLAAGSKAPNYNVLEENS